MTVSFPITTPVMISTIFSENPVPVFHRMTSVGLADKCCTMFAFQCWCISELDLNGDKLPLLIQFESRGYWTTPSPSRKKEQHPFWVLESGVSDKQEGTMGSTRRNAAASLTQGMLVCLLRMNTWRVCSPVTSRTESFYFVVKSQSFQMDFKSFSASVTRSNRVRLDEGDTFPRLDVWQDAKWVCVCLCVVVGVGGENNDNGGISSMIYIQDT